MARRGFKQRWTRVVPAAAERSVYVLASSLAMIAMYAFWQPLPGIVCELEHPVAAPFVGREAALAELRRHGGMQFDPLLVEAFVELFAERMPYTIDGGFHGHSHLPGDVPDARTNAEIHDALHDRRRRVVPSAQAVHGKATGTRG